MIPPVRPTRSSARAVLASESRLQLLDTLRAAGRGMDAGELAAGSGLHVSTVRFHLNELRGAGLVDAHAESGAGRGRPRQLFYPISNFPVSDGAASQASESDAQRTGYERLARVMAASIVSGDTPGAAVERAESAGRQWAAELVNPPQSTTAVSGRAAAAKVNGLFAGLGFDSELRSDGDQTRLLLLHACPFKAVATDYPDVVCSLHLGLLRGALSALGADGVEAHLDRHVTPELCVAHVGAPPQA